MCEIEPPVLEDLELLEDIDSLPDEACVWGKPNDGDCWSGFHEYADCVKCGESCDDCVVETPLKNQVSLDCLRNLARDRNRLRRSRNRRRVDVFEAQMVYYRTLVPESSE